MADFIWHKVSESEKEEIRQNAKRILDNFASKLTKVNADISSHEESEMRPEGEPWTTPEDFRDTMLSNAPDSDEGFIIAEKGGWK